MTLVNAESGRVLQDDDVRLAAQIAERAAVAIENARLYSERSRIAHTLQQSLLPEALPEIPGYELASLYLPAVDGSEVGGRLLRAVGGRRGLAARRRRRHRQGRRGGGAHLAGPAHPAHGVGVRLQPGGAARPARPHAARPAAALDLHRAVRAAGARPARGRLRRPSAAADGHRARAWSSSGPTGRCSGRSPTRSWPTSSSASRREATLIAYTDGVTDAVGGGRGAVRGRAAARRARALPGVQRPGGDRHARRRPRALRSRATRRRHRRGGRPSHAARRGRTRRRGARGRSGVGAGPVPCRRGRLRGDGPPRLPSPPPGTFELRALNWLTAAHVAAYRRTGGRIGGKLKGAPVLLLDHVGRRSGTRARRRCCTSPTAPDLVIVASAGGREATPAWWLNLRAAPETTVQVGSERRRVQARVAERRGAGAAVVAGWWRCSPTTTSTGSGRAREIPVIVLSPAG